MQCRLPKNCCIADCPAARLHSQLSHLAASLVCPLSYNSPCLSYNSACMLPILQLSCLYYNFPCMSYILQLPLYAFYLIQLCFYNLQLCSLCRVCPVNYYNTILLSCTLYASVSLHEPTFVIWGPTFGLFLLSCRKFKTLSKTKA